MEPTQTQPVQPAPSEKKSFGPFVGIIVIIIALVLGAFYVWGGKLSSTEETTATSTASNVVATSTSSTATSTTVVKTATSTTVTVTATTTTTTR